MEHHFIEHWTNSRTSFFEHWTNSNVFIYWWSKSNSRYGRWTFNLIGPSLDLLNYSLNRLENHFFKHRTDLNVFIFWLSNYFWLRTSNIHIRTKFDPLRNFRMCINECHISTTLIALNHQLIKFWRSNFNANDFIYANLWLVFELDWF